MAINNAVEQPRRHQGAATANPSSNAWRCSRQIIRCCQHVCGPQIGREFGDTTGGTYGTRRRMFSEHGCILASFRAPETRHGRICIPEERIAGSTDGRDQQVFGGISEKLFSLAQST